VKVRDGMCCQYSKEQMLNENYSFLPRMQTKNNTPKFTFCLMGCNMDLLFQNKIFMLSHMMSLHPGGLNRLSFLRKMAEHVV
jgi:hypothetical protein